MPKNVTCSSRLDSFLSRHISERPDESIARLPSRILHLSLLRPSRNDSSLPPTLSPPHLSPRQAIHLPVRSRGITVIRWLKYGLIGAADLLPCQPKDSTQLSFIWPLNPSCLCRLDSLLARAVVASNPTTPTAQTPRSLTPQQHFPGRCQAVQQTPSR